MQLRANPVPSFIHSESELQMETLLGKVGRASDYYHGAVNVPVFHTSTVVFPSLKAFQDSEKNSFETLCYGRLGNPTTWAFEAAIAQLEGGYKGIIAPSGLMIITTVLLAFTKAGQHVLIPESVYGGVRRFCENVLSELNISVEFYPNSINSKMKELIRPNTSLIYVETPTSIDFKMTDLPAITRIAKKSNIPVIVDNTWATPLYYQPLRHGADVSIHSATKYILGHSDALLGIAVCNQKTWPIVKKMSYFLGVSVNSDDAFLGLRGIRTLGIRMQRHQSSALKIAKWLQKQPEVARVYYPALQEDTGYRLWKRDFTGASGRFSIQLKKANYDSIASLLNQLQHFSLGFSWGGFESMIVPVHLNSSKKNLLQETTFCLSIGLEDPEDLIEDLAKGLRRLKMR